MSRISTTNSEIKFNQLKMLNKIGAGTTSVVYNAKLIANNNNKHRCLNLILYKTVPSTYDDVDSNDILIIKQENKIVNDDEKG